MTQLDMLALLEPETPASAPVLDRDAHVLGHYLADWQVHQAVRALATDLQPSWPDFRAGLVGGHQGAGGTGYRWQTERDGVHVLRWPGAEPWVIGWPRVRAVLVEHIERAGPAAVERIQAADLARPKHHITREQRPFVPHIHRTAELDAADAEFDRRFAPWLERERELLAARRDAAHALLPRLPIPEPPAQPADDGAPRHEGA